MGITVGRPSGRPSPEAGFKFPDRTTDTSGTMTDRGSFPIDSTTVALLGPTRATRVPGSRRLDEFSAQAGPDVKIDGPAGPVAMFAVFTVDPETDEVRVAVIDDQGRLVRVIPPDSVSEMVATMQSYRAGG